MPQPGNYQPTQPPDIQTAATRQITRAATRLSDDGPPAANPAAILNNLDCSHNQSNHRNTTQHRSRPTPLLFAVIQFAIPSCIIQYASKVSAACFAMLPARAWRGNPLNRTCCWCRNGGTWSATCHPVVASLAAAVKADLTTVEHWAQAHNTRTAQV
jgi:hypothetical protein